jgi:3-phosphoglycerate kinase
MRLKPGQVLMLENVRFHAAEENNDADYAATLAAYGEVYVNDAFGSAHRAHASTVGIASHLPAYAGLLMEAELKALSTLLESPARPFAAVIGGAKVSTKLAVLDNLLKKVDVLLIGGGMANTFLVAQGHTVGKSLLERDLVPAAQGILEAAARRNVELLLPSDVVVAKEVTRGAEHKVVPAHKIPNSWSVVDIGPVATQAFTDALEPARTVLWNGPLGVFEVPTFGDGTRAMARYLARRAEAGAAVVVGGGDSAAAVEELGLTARMTHVSTGGGASLEFLEGRELPGVAVLLDRQVEKPKRAPRPVVARTVAAPPVRTVAKAPAKAPARVAAKVVPKAPTKTAASVPARAPAQAVARPAPKAPAKPAPKKPVRAAAKPAAKRPVAAKTVARKPAAKPVAKAAAKKPVAKAAANKPVAKAAVKKPAAKPVARAAAKKPAARAPAKKPAARAPATKPAARAAPKSAKPATKGRPAAKTGARPTKPAARRQPVATRRRRS